MSAVIGRRQPIRLASLGPARPGGRTDPERPELVEGEGPLGPLGQRVLDPVQLGVEVRVGGLLPRLGPLESDPATGQQGAQRLAADPYRMGDVAA